MTPRAQDLLIAFEHLETEEKREFAGEILRRCLPFDSGPLADSEIGAASSALFRTLDDKDADPESR